MRFELVDGRVVDAKKDCTCADHAGPHWLHADALWKRRNDDLRGIAADPLKEPLKRHLAMLGLAQEESARLAAKLQCLQTYGINRILHDAEDANDSRMKSPLEP